MIKYLLRCLLVLLIQIIILALAVVAFATYHNIIFIGLSVLFIASAQGYRKDLQL